MKKVNSNLGWDFYTGKDSEGRPNYNIVGAGEKSPEDGYLSAEHIAKQKKVPVRYFFNFNK
ncbi:MAG: hypothetical protein ACJARG_000044 [Arcticibacterium sp.]|jgi:hypothetical protein